MVRPNGESQRQIAAGVGSSGSGQLFLAEHAPGKLAEVEDLPGAPAISREPPRTSHGPHCLRRPRRDPRSRRHTGRHQRCQVGEALPDAHGTAFRDLGQGHHLPCLPPGTEDLLGELRRCSIATALATSSTTAHLNATLASSGLDLDRLVDHIVTGGPSLDSKPAPDLIEAALAKLGSDPPRSVMVGDTNRADHEPRPRQPSSRTALRRGELEIELNAPGFDVFGTAASTDNMLQGLDRARQRTLSLL